MFYSMYMYMYMYKLLIFSVLKMVHEIMISDWKIPT